MKMTEKKLRTLVKSVLNESRGSGSVKLVPGKMYRLQTNSNEWVAEFVRIGGSVAIDTDSSLDLNDLELIYRDADGTEWAAYIRSDGRLAFGSSAEVLQVDYM